MEAAVQLIDLGKYGAVGVILALVGLTAWVVYINWKTGTEYHRQLSKQAESSNQVARDGIMAIREHTQMSERLIQTVASLEKTIEC